MQHDKSRIYEQASPVERERHYQESFGREEGPDRCPTHLVTLRQLRLELTRVNQLSSSDSFWKDTLRQWINHVTMQLPHICQHGHPAAAQCTTCCNILEAVQAAVDLSAAKASIANAAVEAIPLSNQWWHIAQHNAARSGAHRHFAKCHTARHCTRSPPAPTAPAHHRHHQHAKRGANSFGSLSLEHRCRTPTHKAASVSATLEDTVGPAQPKRRRSASHPTRRRQIYGSAVLRKLSHSLCTWLIFIKVSLLAYVSMLLKHSFSTGRTICHFPDRTAIDSSNMPFLLRACVAPPSMHTI